MSGEHRWLLVTPAQNEARNLPALAGSLVSQIGGWQGMWVVVDDASTDGTDGTYESLLPLPFPSMLHRRPSSLGLAGGGAFRAFLDGAEVGLEAMPEATAVMKLDADMVLRPDFLAQLGGAGRDAGVFGGVVMGRGERVRRGYIHGGIKAYSRESFEIVRRLPPATGFDVIDQVAVAQAGLRTRVVATAVASSRRETGSSVGRLTGRRRAGRMARWTGYHPVYFAGRLTRWAARRPFGVGALAMAYGWATAGAGPFPPELRHAHSAQQRQLMTGFLRHPSKVRSFFEFPSKGCDSQSTPGNRPWEQLKGRLGVVVISHNSTETIGRCLGTLPAGLGGAVVVDNASRDDTASLAAGARVLCNSANVGFGVAANQGRQELPQSEFILVLNPDAAIGERDLRELCTYLERNPACGLVGPRLRGAEGLLTSAGRRPTLATELRLVVPPAVATLLPERRYSPAYANSGPTGYIEGACMLFRAGAFDSVGGFDPRYFLFYEEQDIAHALRGAGWSVDLCAEAQAFHQGRVSRRSLPDDGRAQLLGSAVTYLEKNHGRVAATVFQAVGLAHVIERIVRRKLSADSAGAQARALTGGRPPVVGGFDPEKPR